MSTMNRLWIVGVSIVILLAATTLVVAAQAGEVYLPLLAGNANRRALQPKRYMKSKRVKRIHWTATPSWNRLRFPPCRSRQAERHTCAVTEDGRIKCWGYNAYGELGDTTGLDRNAPVDVVGLGEQMMAVAGGDYHKSR